VEPKKGINHGGNEFLVWGTIIPVLDVGILIEIIFMLHFKVMTCMI